MSDFLQGSEGESLPFEFSAKHISTEQQQQHWKSVEAAIITEPTKARRRWPILAAAFSLVGIVIAATWYFSATVTPTNKYHTGFAQIKNITLPDGSVVVLNANSTLTIPTNWSAQGNREVWLEGEAYFTVEKKPATHQKFVVHAKDLDVEVLGTKFNVNTRHQKSTVSLEEGKVLLKAKGELEQVLSKQKPLAPIEMKPGQVVETSQQGVLAVVNEKEVSTYSGWVRNEFHFNNTSLEEIATMIEDVYGYTINITNEQFKQRTISGDLRAANIQELTEVLQLAFKLKMTIDKKTITISLP